MTSYNMAKMFVADLPEREQIQLSTELMLMSFDAHSIAQLHHSAHLVSRHADELARSVPMTVLPVTATPAFLPRDPVAGRGTFPEGQVPSGVFGCSKWEWVEDAAGVACLFGLLWVLLLVAGAMG